MPEIWNVPDPPIAVPMVVPGVVSVPPLRLSVPLPVKFAPTLTEPKQVLVPPVWESVPFPPRPMYSPASDD